MNKRKTYGGIVLCGGRSKRMGLPKATLPFGPEMMLTRMIRLLREVVDPIVVVAAPHQELPELDNTVILAHDLRSDRGPLEGLYAGLLAARDHVDAAFVTSCDVPFLRTPLVTRMIELSQGYEIVVPKDDRHVHPLAGIYATHLVLRIQDLLTADRLRPLFLIQESHSRQVPVDELRGVDPDLSSFANLNTPTDYLNALADAGLNAPDEITARFNKM